jgi:hypothetical protein
MYVATDNLPSNCAQHVSNMLIGELCTHKRKYKRFYAHFGEPFRNMCVKKNNFHSAPLPGVRTISLVSATVETYAVHTLGNVWQALERD